MCVYLGATDDLMEITFFVLCRVLELSLFTCMMICNAIKSKWNNTKAIEMAEP
ncbi:GL10722 [Drosophila persimilis]|uniref:Uncharacterized protein prim n=3 Tax=obscura group TaxID=32355 RepID=A0A6I8V5A1_DROPS|nr:uncharacterized protein LOC6898254 [Drosophila pseudoobscura]XP_017147642.1 uncharacterized protein LOC108159155 [Drosophila miranda]XP_026842281.1 uncharacterized protein LOC6590733 [Drosophila persimilis]XP_034130040.1 uncharacterized protein LOC117584951 [Drosophila guanche]EDW31886.1 GL10722 [Drosophila persimilis]SPP73416.1 Hypothetical predicted protein [Drosophila guanche]